MHGGVGKKHCGAKGDRNSPLRVPPTKIKNQEVKMEQKTVKIQNSEITARVFGSYDINVRTVEKAFSVKVYNRSDEDGDAVMINGESREAVVMAADCVKYLADMARYNESLSEQGHIRNRYDTRRQTERACRA